jgi:hypothetical protein
MRAVFAAAILALVSHVAHGNQFMDTFQVSRRSSPFVHVFCLCFSKVFFDFCNPFCLMFFYFCNTEALLPQSCSQSFNGGFSYDLTPMVRTAGARAFLFS